MKGFIRKTRGGKSYLHNGNYAVEIDENDTEMMKLVESAMQNGDLSRIVAYRKAQKGKALTAQAENEREGE